MTAVIDVGLRLLGCVCCLLALLCNVRPVPSEANVRYPLLTARQVVLTLVLAGIGSLLIERRTWYLPFTVTLAGSAIVWAVTHFVLNY
jgi:hypothetical protein